MGWCCPTYPITSRGLNKWTCILNVCQTLLQRKTFSNYYIYPQSTEGTVNVDTAGLELLNRLLSADLHLQEQLNTYLTRQSQSNCWIYQTGSGSFTCKLENKVSSSTLPKSSNIPYCNKDIIILLSSCSVHFKHLVQPWCRLDLRWNGQVCSTPFPFFLLRGYWYEIHIDMYFTSHNIFFKIFNNRYLTARVYLTQKPCSHPKNSLSPASGNHM